MTWGQVAGLLMDAMFDGLIPQSSIFARSGRGIYVFWVLKDEQDETQPPRGFLENRALYKRINRAIGERLRHLAWDELAFDASRVLRVPGTLHHKTQEPAVYTAHFDAEGRNYSYTLAELAAFFDVRDVRPSLPNGVRALVYGEDWAEVDEAHTEHVHLSRRTINPGSVPARKNGRDALYAKRAHDLTTLETDVGGWPHGRRRRHLAMYAHFLKEAGQSQADVLRAVRVMALNCRPAYPSDVGDIPTAKIVADEFNPTERKKRKLDRLTHGLLCEMLGITHERAEELELLTIIPESLKIERTPPLGGQREVEKQARRAFIRAHYEEHGCISARLMVEALEAAGHEVSRRTVNDDMNALGYATEPTRRAGRPPKAQRLAREAAQQVLVPLED